MMQNKQTHKPVSVKKRVNDLLRFLKNEAGVFSAVHEFNSRAAKSANYYSSWACSSPRTAIEQDYLLLLNKAETLTTGITMGISIYYQGLTNEESYFVASVSSYEIVKKNDEFWSNNSKPYYKSGEIFSSVKMSYEEFSEKLRKFNKLIREHGKDNDFNVLQVFSEIMGVLTDNNVKLRSETKKDLKLRFDDINKQIDEKSETLEKLQKKENAQRNKIDKRLGIAEDEAEIRRLESALLEVRKKLQGKQQIKRSELFELRNQIASVNSEINENNKLKNRIVSEAKLVIRNTDFLYQKDED